MKPAKAEFLQAGHSYRHSAISAKVLTVHWKDSTDISTFIDKTDFDVKRLSWHRNTLWSCVYGKMLAASAGSDITRMFVLQTMDICSCQFSTQVWIFTVCLLYSNTNAIVSPLQTYVSKYNTDSKVTVPNKSPPVFSVAFYIPAWMENSVHAI